jgi:2-phosphoglycerate kinase
MPAHTPEWTVLLVGGSSGIGKSTAAARIGRQFGLPWLHVDDIRLAMQWSRVSLPNPQDTAALYFFDENPAVWRLSAEQLRDGLIGLGRVLSPAIAKLVTNHVAIDEPIVIEGDGIVPSLLAEPALQECIAQGSVRTVFIVEPNEAAIHTNLVARALGIATHSEAELRTHVHMHWLYGQWLAGEARHHGAPVLQPQPWATLANRILAHATTKTTEP